MSTLRIVNLVVTALLFGTVSASAESITFKVPYDVKLMGGSQVQVVRIVCATSNASGAIGSAIGQKIQLDSNGSASGTATLVLKPNPGKAARDSTKWTCQLGCYASMQAETTTSCGDAAKPGMKHTLDAKSDF